MKTVAFFLFVLVHTAFGETPTKTMEAFKEAAKKQDFESTWELATKFEDAPDEVTAYLKEKVQRVLTIFGSGWDVTILDEKIEGNCAVLVLNESKKDGEESFDIDPGYLLKQGGEWKVFPDVSDFDILEHVDKDKLETFAKLEAWYKERKAEIKLKRNGD